MSGAAEYLDQYDRELETTKVLAEDGSSTDLLAYRLHTLLATYSLYCVCRLTYWIDSLGTFAPGGFQPFD
jgi:hypothetical protein